MKKKKMGIVLGILGALTASALLMPVPGTKKANEDKTIYCDAVEVTVTFYGYGSVSVEAGSLVEKPEDPVKGGYTFDGWFRETTYINRFDFVTDTVTESITLYPNFIKGTAVSKVNFTAYPDSFHNGNSTAPAISSSGCDIASYGAYYDEGLTKTCCAIALKPEDGYNLEDLAKSGILGLPSDFNVEGIVTVENQSSMSTKYGIDLTDGDLVVSYPVSVTSTITYDANGATSGTVPSDDRDYSYGESITLDPNTSDTKLQRTGYLFMGWSTDKEDTSGISIATAGFAAATYYAIWSPNPVISEIELASVPKYYVNSNSDVSATSANLRYGAYGWTTYTEGNVHYAVTIFRANDGYSFNTEVSSSYGEVTVADASNLSSLKTKYSFEFLTEGDAVLSIPLLDAYTITYDANGATSGTIPTDTNCYTFGKKVTLDSNESENKLVRTNYKFMGWSTDKDATSGTYSYYISDSSVTLYAIWAWDYAIHEVTFTHSPLSLRADSSDAATVSASGHYEIADYKAYTDTDGNNWYGVALRAKDGYDFSEFTSSDIKNAPYGYVADGLVTDENKGALSLEYKIEFETGDYAVKWPIHFISNITYDQNGATSGSVMTDSKDHYSGDLVWLDGNNREDALVREGYSFLGWNTDPSAAAPLEFCYIVGNSDVTFYAIWKAKEEIRLDLTVQGCHVTDSEKGYVIPSDLSGFHITYSYKEEVYEDLSEPHAYTVTITRAEDETYAAYSAETEYDVGYYLIYSGNGMDGDVLINYGYSNADTTVSVLSPSDSAISFERAGYEFHEWNTKKDGSGTAISEGMSLSLTEDMTIYAAWKLTDFTEPSMENDYTVRANAKGGFSYQWQMIKDGVVTDIPGEVGKSLKETPEDASYRCAITTSSGVTTYTKEVKPHKVTYSTLDLDAYFLEGRSVDLTKASPKAASLFVGWSLMEDDVEALSSYTMKSEDITLYPVYQDLMKRIFNKDESVILTSEYGFMADISVSLTKEDASLYQIPEGITLYGGEEVSGIYATKLYKNDYGVISDVAVTDIGDVILRIKLSDLEAEYIQRVILSYSQQESYIINVDPEDVVDGYYILSCTDEIPEIAVVIDETPAPGKGLSKGALAGIITGSVLGFFLILYILGYVFYRSGHLNGHLAVIYKFLPKKRKPEIKSEEEKTMDKSEEEKEE